MMPPDRSSINGASSISTLLCSSTSPPSWASVNPRFNGSDDTASRSGQYPRVYEVWHHLGGRNRFFCWGRCVTGPRMDIGYNCCAWWSILTPTIFFFVACAEHFWSHNSTKWLPILTVVTLAFTIIFLLLTSYTDPGIIPRHSLQIAVEGLEEEVAQAIGCTSVNIDLATSDPVCNLSESQQNMGYKWCPSCKVIRPPRASHCRDCDNCVLTMDHHCPFVNNCVGQRNYAFFTCFLLFTVLHGLVVVGGIIFRYTGRDSLRWNWHNPMIYVFMIIAVPAAVLLIIIICFMIFHMCLVCRGQTTKEVRAGPGKIVIGGGTLFISRGKSLIHPRAVVRYPMSVL